MSLRFLRSEIRLMCGRRRNQAGLVVLAAVPVFLAIAVKINGQGPRGGDNGPNFLASITGNGVFVAFAALTIELTLFLPMAIAMVSGDAIAGEAHTGTLRYLLTVPTSRIRLLVVKYLALVVGSLIVTATVVVVGVVVGIAVFGTGPLTTLSGSQISLAAGLWRLLISLLYVAAGLCALAAIGLFLSTLTEQPIAVTVAVVVVTTSMWILDSIPQVAFLHGWLLVDRWPDFADLMRSPADFTSVWQGIGVDAAYTLIFLAAAWARFAGKDITS